MFPAAVRFANIAGVSGGGNISRPTCAAESGRRIRRLVQSCPERAVTRVALQPDGRLIVGGSFTHARRQSRVGIARLSLGVRPCRCWASAPTARPRRGLAGLYWRTLGRDLRAVGGIASPGRGSARGRASLHVELAADGAQSPAGGCFTCARGALRRRAAAGHRHFPARPRIQFRQPDARANSTHAPATAAAPTFAFDPFTASRRARPSWVVPAATPWKFPAASAARAAGADTAARLVNLSTRGRVTAESPLILGFAISAPKRAACWCARSARRSPASAWAMRSRPPGSRFTTRRAPVLTAAEGWPAPPIWRARSRRPARFR